MNQEHNTQLRRKTREPQSWLSAEESQTTESPAGEEAEADRSFADGFHRPGERFTDFWLRVSRGFAKNKLVRDPRNGY